MEKTIDSKHTLQTDHSICIRYNLIVFFKLTPSVNVEIPKSSVRLKN